MIDVITSKKTIVRHINHLEEALLKEHQETLVEIVAFINSRGVTPGWECEFVIDHIQEKIAALQPRISALHTIEHPNG